MFQRFHKLAFQSRPYASYIKRTFLTNAYSCTEAWISRTSTPILSKVNLNDFYNMLDQSYSSKGVISATDVDIFANAIKDANYLDELRDLLYKLRLSSETGGTLPSTHYATIRNYTDFGNTQDLLEILKDPLNYGIFLDDHSCNILLNKLLTSQKYEEAATVASVIMLQEEYCNEITIALCQYACYKFVQSYKSQLLSIPEKTNKKPDEIKIRVKFLRNPYYDDHFDIRDKLQLTGKTMAWLALNRSDNLSLNLQLAGWILYKKYDKLSALCKEIAVNDKFKLYAEIKEILMKEQSKETTEDGLASATKECLNNLNKTPVTDISLEVALKLFVENAINKIHNHDVSAQQQVTIQYSICL